MLQKNDLKQYKETVKKDATALRYIQLGLSKGIYPRTLGVKKAKEAWDILRNEYKGTEKVNSNFLSSCITFGRIFGSCS